MINDLSMNPPDSFNPNDVRYTPFSPLPTDLCKEPQLQEWLLKIIESTPGSSSGNLDRTNILLELAICRPPGTMTSALQKVLDILSEMLQKNKHGVHFPAPPRLKGSADEALASLPYISISPRNRIRTISSTSFQQISSSPAEQIALSFGSSGEMLDHK